MNREEVFEYVKRVYGTTPDYPWNDHNVVLRHKNNKKWYAAILQVAGEKIGLEGTEPVDVINLKCDPMLIGSLRTRFGFHPAYHMNKDKWISVRLDGSVAEEEIKNLVALSYELTADNKKRNCFSTSQVVK